MFFLRLLEFRLLLMYTDLTKHSRKSNWRYFMKISVQLHRPYDRDPDDHFYGEPFDSKLDILIGGSANWSSPRQDRTQLPAAVIPGQRISVYLHEDGPVFDFVMQNIDKIPDYINAVAALLTAWTAARVARRRSLPKNDSQAESGTVIEMEEFRIISKRNLKPKEVIEIMSSLARFPGKTKPKKKTPPKATKGKKRTNR